jgi:hypothetical protein
VNDAIADVQICNEGCLAALMDARTDRHEFLLHRHSCRVYRVTACRDMSVMSWCCGHDTS